jgi:hypothetical protein
MFLPIDIISEIIKNVSTKNAIFFCQTNKENIKLLHKDKIWFNHFQHHYGNFIVTTKPNKLSYLEWYRILMTNYFSVKKEPCDCRYRCCNNNHNVLDWNPKKYHKLILGRRILDWAIINNYFELFQYIIKIDEEWKYEITGESGNSVTSWTNIFLRDDKYVAGNGWINHPNFNKRCYRHYNHNEKPIILASRYNKTEIIKHLFNYDDIKEIRKIFSNAVEQKNIEIMNFLCKKYVGIKYLLNEFLTLVCKHNIIEVIMSIMEIYPYDKFYSIVYQYCSPQLIKFLIKQGFSFNLADFKLCIQYDRDQILKTLICHDPEFFLNNLHELLKLAHNESYQLILRLVELCTSTPRRKINKYDIVRLLKSINKLYYIEKVKKYAMFI